MVTRSHESPQAWQLGKGALIGVARGCTPRAEKKIGRGRQIYRGKIVSAPQGRDCTPT